MKRYIQAALLVGLCGASAFAVDPDASTVVATASTAFGTAAVLGIAILGYKKVRGIVASVAK